MNQTFTACLPAFMPLPLALSKQGGKMFRNGRAIIARLYCCSIENGPGEHVNGLAAVIIVWLRLMCSSQMPRGLKCTRQRKGKDELAYCLGYLQIRIYMTGQSRDGL